MGRQPGAIFADPAAYADPVAWHEEAARIRRESPILRVELDEYPTFWAITKHADVMEIERNSEIFTNAPTPAMGLKSEMRDGADPGVNTLVQMDGEEHRAHRAIVNEWFKPGQIKKLQGRTEELAKRFVDEMAAKGGQCDFATDIAMHYPLHVILSILGLPETDYDRMLKLTQEMFGAEDPDIGRAGEDNSIFEVLMDFAAYFQALAADRRARPTSDLASVIANATIDDEPLPDMDIVGFYLIIATAGHDTTSNSIGGGLLALIENPDQLARLRETPELVDNAADEIIRWVSPGEAVHPHVPGTVHPPRRHVRARRPAPPVVPVGEPRRRGVRRSVPLRRRPRQRVEPPRDRVRSPLLPRRAPGATRDPLLLPRARAAPGFRGARGHPDLRPGPIGRAAPSRCRSATRCTDQRLPVASCARGSQAVPGMAPAGHPSFGSRTVGRSARRLRSRG